MKAMIFNGKKLYETEYDTDSYSFISTNVGGFIERIPLRCFEERHIDMWADEEGKLKELETTILLYHDRKIYDNVVGTVVFTKSDDEGETISLTEDDIKFIKDKFGSDGFYIDLHRNCLIQVLNY